MTASRKSLLLSALGGCLALAYLAGSAWSDPAGKHEHAAAGAAMLAQSALPDSFQWDDKYSKDLEVSLHQLHEVWNTGDFAALKQFIIGDDILPTFELDPRTHQPIKLESKTDLDGFIARVVSTQDSRKLVTELDAPKVKCRATATWGFCTEECSVKYKAQSGELLGTDKLWSTQIAINTAKGWRWIQWHMSDASPPQSVNIR
jgi:SnoaL-like domain